MDAKPYAGRIFWVDLTRGSYSRQDLLDFWPLPPSSRHERREMLNQEWRSLLATFRG